MTREEVVFSYLREHDIPFSCYQHPEGKTIEEAKRWWKNDGSVHCKNLFFRNHKGNKHYLVCFDCNHNLDIHDLEHRLKESLVSNGFPSCGKLSFASPERMMRYLGLEPGSVSPFGLINDVEHHVHLFLDDNLKKAQTQKKRRGRSRVASISTVSAPMYRPKEPIGRAPQAAIIPKMFHYAY